MKLAWVVLIGLLVIACGGKVVYVGEGQGGATSQSVSVTGGQGGTSASGGAVQCEGADPVSLPGKPCDAPGEFCGGYGTSCYPIIQCTDGHWTQSEGYCPGVDGGGLDAL